MSSLPPHLDDYRKVLVAADQKGQEEFDKAVLALSGGGLGVSLVFLKDVIGSDPIKEPGFLIAAWVAWAISTLAVLASYWLSLFAIRKGIRQIDSGAPYTAPFGGWYSKATQGCNVAGAMLFVVGVLLVTYFAGVNLHAKGEANGHKTATATTAAASALAAPTRATTTTGAGREARVGAPEPAAPASAKGIAEPAKDAK